MADSKRSETGHDINVSNLGDLIAALISFGPVYNPPRPELQISYLQQKHQEAKDVLRLVSDREVIKQYASNQCSEAFKGLRPYVTRIINAMTACGISGKSVDDARVLQRLMTGGRATKKDDEKDEAATENPAEMAESEPAAEDKNTGSKTISVSHQSQDKLVGYLGKLGLLVQREMNYIPNEPELQVGSIMAYEQQLRMLLDAVAPTEADLDAARIQRTEVLYDPTNGAIPLALQAKIYIKALFGAKSAKYKQVSGIAFRIIKDK